MAGTLNFVSKYDGRGVRAAKKDLNALGKDAAWAKAKFAAAAFVIYKFGKASVNAALDDAQAQAALNNTLRNAGWGKSSDALAKYIDQMQRATGVADDELRPAFTSLFNAAQDVNIAQRLMETGMSVSLGTGKDLATVSAALAKALTGNRKALVGLGTGLDTAVLKTGSLSTILSMLDKKFAGATTANAETFAGKMQIVNIAAGEAAETIGGALIDAFIQIAGDGSVSDATQAMDDFGASTARVIKASGWLISKLRSVSGYILNLPLHLNEALYGSMDSRDGTAAGKATTAEAARRAQITGMQKFYDEKRKNAYLDNWMAKWQAKQDAAAKLAEAERLAALRKQNAEKAKALKLAKLAAKYDLELIGLAAATKNNKGNAGVLGRLTDLTTLATANAGLPVSAAALAGAKNTQVSNVQVIVQGSVISQRDLTDTIARQLRNAQAANGYGQWGGGL